MVLRELACFLEETFPLSFQESYDNSGLQVGDPEQEITLALIAVDITEEVIDEAIRLKAGLIISHHPLIFNGLKKLTGNGYVQRCVIKAVRNNIALYACHTNADNLVTGLNGKLAKRIGLIYTRVLAPIKGKLCKLVCFVPLEFAERVRQAIFAAGAGYIGEYDCCSFNVEGKGTFRGSENSNPFVGEKGKLHIEEEARIETILPVYLQERVVDAMIDVHPYEEPAFDIYPLENKFNKLGAGIIGEMPEKMQAQDFLRLVQDRLDATSIRHSALLKEPIGKVALCGGSGSFLIKEAIRQGAHVFVTSDLKYHQFFEAEGKILLVDAGHFETEQVVKELFYEVLIKKFPNFALRFSEVNTNPVNYI
jgi:dinuclear metal center YbgI/SA1388 family protein